MSVIYGILLFCNAMICCSLHLVNLRCVEKIMSIQHPFPIQKIIRMLYHLTNKIYISVHVLFILLCMYLFTGVQHYVDIRWCSCRLTVTQRVLLVEQNLLTHPEHLSSTSVFSGFRVARSLVFCGVFCRSLFVLFPLAIVLSVLLRFTDSDYTFGIFWPLCCLSFFDLRILITPLVSFGYCVVCPSSTYGFWLHLWYLQALLTGDICEWVDKVSTFWSQA